MEFLCKACHDLVSVYSGAPQPSPTSLEAAVKIVDWSGKIVRTLPEVMVVSRDSRDSRERTNEQASDGVIE